MKLNCTIVLLSLIFSVQSFGKISQSELASQTPVINEATQILPLGYYKGIQIKKNKSETCSVDFALRYAGNVLQAELSISSDVRLGGFAVEETTTKIIEFTNEKVVIEERLPDHLSNTMTLIKLNDSKVQVIVDYILFPEGERDDIFSNYSDCVIDLSTRKHCDRCVIT